MVSDVKMTRKFDWYLGGNCEEVKQKGDLWRRVHCPADLSPAIWGPLAFFALALGKSGPLRAANPHQEFS